ncbi:MAG TPA: hypothetical protein VEI06_02905 [Gemmatimonadaceae bacterium]|nr:hypothetical protein [Gemmatimonadaceae bacterium]
MKVLVIDVGGTNVKILASNRQDPIKIPSGRSMTPQEMTRKVLEEAQGWTYDVVSIGYPGIVVRGRPLLEPANLGSGWVQFSYARAFGRPVKMINDAAMQAIGSYEGGVMLFLGLGTGLGSALIADGVLEALEIAHMPYRKGKTFEDYLGMRGLERLGKRRWREHVGHVITMLERALSADYVVVGGGNARLLKRLPKGVRRGDNSQAFVGGERIWKNPTLVPAAMLVPATGRRAGKRRSR